MQQYNITPTKRSPQQQNFHPSSSGNQHQSHNSIRMQTAPPKRRGINTTLSNTPIAQTKTQVKHSHSHNKSRWEWLWCGGLLNQKTPNQLRSQSLTHLQGLDNNNQKVETQSRIIKPQHHVKTIDIKSFISGENDRESQLARSIFEPINNHQLPKRTIVARNSFSTKKEVRDPVIEHSDNFQEKFRCTYKAVINSPHVKYTKKSAEKSIARRTVTTHTQEKQIAQRVMTHTEGTYGFRKSLKHTELTNTVKSEAQ